MKNNNLLKTISIITLSVLCALSVIFNIFMLTVFEIKDITSFKQVLLCRELLNSVSQSIDDGFIQDSDAETSGNSTQKEPTKGKVIFTEDNVKITYVGQESGLLGPGLKFLIENNSTKAIDISFTYVYIDGYVAALSGGYCDSLAANKKAYATLTLWESDYEEFTDFPTNVEFVIKLINPESFTTIKQSGLIQITLSR